MRLVLDTNTVLSGLLWQGTPGQLIEAAEAGRIELAASTALLAELQGVLARPKFAAPLAERGVRASDLFDGYAALIVHVTPEAIPRVVPNDPDDDQVLACALAAQADAVVSGDRDLLDLKNFRGIPILTATRAVRLIERTP